MARSQRRRDNGRSNRTAREYERAFLSRNWGLIAPTLQKQLQRQVIFAAGLGLCSEMAVQACRIGFRNFILADGDGVEISNLNRQAFTSAHIGRNKAEATAELLRSLTPAVHVEVIPAYLDESSYLPLLAKATIVVNSVDLDNPTLFALNRDARALGKPVLCPLNLGWGSVVLVFSPTSPSLESFLGLDLPGHESSDRSQTDLVPAVPDILGRLVYRVYAQVPGGIPSYLAGLSDSFEHRASRPDWPADPQLGPTTAVTAAMLVRAAVGLAAGEPVKVVPDINFVDLREIMTSAGLIIGVQ
jgi:molybdopterin/thiamine biosynthesis adenylyltransferase